MPEPEWMEVDDSWLDEPNTQMEILGRGAQSRKSKTNFRDLPQAQVLGLIAHHKHHLKEVFRRLHAAHHTVPVQKTIEVGQENGSVKLKKITEHEPEVLSDKGLYSVYPVIREWEIVHQEQVDHYPSIGGFSVRAATGMRDEEERQKRRESTAGTDRQEENERWK